MIWRSSLTHQDYMKYDVQPMTSKFSIRTSKGKPTKNSSTKAKSMTFLAAMNEAGPSTTSQLPQQQHQQQHEDGFSDQDKYDDGDSMDEEDDDDNLTNEETGSPNNQVLFLNFTSDLSPQTTSPRKKSSAQTKKAAYRVNGVNILNRKNLDSKTAIERMQRRRENHNHVERRRRDTINNTIYELSQVVPNALHTGQKPHKGNILKATLDYILVLQAENQMYRSRLAQTTTNVPGPSTLTNLPVVSPSSSSSSSTSSSMTTLPPLPPTSSPTYTLPIPPVTTLPSLSPVSASPVVDADFS
ncbi:hypothetical protein BCR42DRAFT_417713 [Absidia repens]|uniref:BHLH domain-containing protein n=1 Tax=Absidia repens TaxID=90262 RepID=A0A1X2ICB7_9FUNG|nr:hypothetical protein BCR42DRAFT_417713 [Absidia repens]